MKYFFSLFFYRLLFLLLLPVLIGLLLFHSVKNVGFRHRLSERLGIVPSALKSGGIIVHAASVGEVIALKPFVEKLLLAYPNLPITLTTFTPTGSAQVIKIFGTRVQHCYLPLDVFICSWFFLNKLKPKAMVFMETELWPNIMAQAANKKIKLLLINARLSQHSMKNYQKLTWLLKPCLNHFDKILPQSTNNLTNFITLGANKDNCQLVGNLKFDISNNQSIDDKKAELAKLLPSNRKVWLIASTHQGDEELALHAHQELLSSHPELLLVIVPRHPERFNTVAELCLKQGFTLVRRSENKVVEQATQVWLLDSLGELMAAYSLSTIVTMGGSFNDINGHNPLEPALFNKPIIVGPFMANFAEIEQQLCEVAGIVQLATSEVKELVQAVNSLLKDELQQKRLGKHAYQVIIENQGASERTLIALQALLTPVENMVSSQIAQTFYQYNASMVADFNPEMFKVNFWQQQHAITGSAQGRGTTWFIQHQKQHWVLRHYYRGGLIGKVNKDRYLFTHQAATRAAKEFNLLNIMQQWQLPAPKPIAYRVIRRGLWYQADLLSSRIENSQDLVAILSKKNIATDLWFSIGATIKRFHHHGIYHADLNAHNILLDDNEKSWLIDFDQGQQRAVKIRWQQNNLQRLLRSFRKEKNQLSSFYWQEDNWQMLLKGYYAIA